MGGGESKGGDTLIECSEEENLFRRFMRKKEAKSVPRYKTLVIMFIIENCSPSSLG